MTAQEWYEKKFDKGSQIGINDFYDALDAFAVTQDDRIFLINHLDNDGLIRVSHLKGWLEWTQLHETVIRALAKALEDRL